MRFTKYNRGPSDSVEEHKKRNDETNRKRVNENGKYIGMRGEDGVLVPKNSRASKNRRINFTLAHLDTRAAHVPQAGKLRGSSDKPRAASTHLHDELLMHPADDMAIELGWNILIADNAGSPDRVYFRYDCELSLYIRFEEFKMPGVDLEPHQAQVVANLMRFHVGNPFVSVNVCDDLDELRERLTI